MGLEVHLIGTIGKTPELKGEGDKQYCVVGVATDKFVGDGKGDPGRDGQPTNRKTTWIDVVFFKQTAKYVTDRFSQGDKLMVRGELEIRRYEKKDRDSGQVIDPNAVSVRVLANDLEGPFRVVSKNGNGNGEAASANDSQAPARASAPARQAAPARGAAPAKQAAAPKAGPAPADDDIPFGILGPMVLPLTGLIAGAAAFFA